MENMIYGVFAEISNGLNRREINPATDPWVAPLIIGVIAGVVVLLIAFIVLFALWKKSILPVSFMKPFFRLFDKWTCPLCSIFRPHGSLFTELGTKEEQEAISLEEQHH